MSLKSAIAKPYARFVTNGVMRRAMEADVTQEQVLAKLIKAARSTAFGKEHALHEVSGHEELVQAVPLRDYEGIKPYIERIREGEKDVLWPGRPLYLCKTSGTTSGAKYIPITRASLPNHIESARRALLAYITHSDRTEFVDGKIDLSTRESRLGQERSHPLRSAQRDRGEPCSKLPAQEPHAQLRHQHHRGLGNEGGGDRGRNDAGRYAADQRIPAWVQMYFERLLARTGKANVLEVFPKLSLFVYGGVNYAPYRSRMQTLIGGDVPSVELFPASEGFIAYQDQEHEEGLLLGAGQWYLLWLPTGGPDPHPQLPRRSPSEGGQPLNLQSKPGSFPSPRSNSTSNMRWSSTPTPASGAMRSGIPSSSFRSLRHGSS